MAAGNAGRPPRQKPPRCPLMRRIRARQDALWPQLVSTEYAKRLPFPYVSKIVAEGDWDDHARSRRVRRCRLPAKQGLLRAGARAARAEALDGVLRSGRRVRQDDGERPSFFIEAHGEPVRGRLHIALRARESVAS